MSDIKRYGHISYLVEATPKIVQLYPEMTIYVLAEDYTTAQSELSALREENERLKSESFEELYNAVIDERDAMREELAIAVEQVIQHEENCWPTEAKTYRQRLTAAEQRNAELVELLKRGEPVIRGRDIYGAKQLANEILATLKPTESGASE